MKNILDSLEEEEKVLEWLLEFRDTVEQAEESDESIIEDVNSKVLQALIQNTDSLAVLFYDGNSKKSTQVLVELENIGKCGVFCVLLKKFNGKIKLTFLSGKTTNVTKKEYYL